ncbi:ARID DNA-binding domain-containing protein [Tanacetum coccineum]
MNPLTLVKRIQNINLKEASLGISEDASWHAKYKDSAYVYVGGIPFDLTEGDLLAVFTQAWYKDGLVKNGETEKVGCEKNPHEGVGSSGLQVVKDNTRERFKNIQGGETHFGVILESDNETDGDQVTDQRDEGNTSENDDFVVVT